MEEDLDVTEGTMKGPPTAVGVRRSGRIRKPNVRYQDYIQTIIDSESTETKIGNNDDEELIATRVTKYIMT